MSRLFSLVLTMLVLALYAAEANAGRRIALVIGNSTYVKVGTLPNPANDARLISKSLEATGFEVKLVIDTNQATMKRAMLDFGRDLREDVDASVFYYAGHGVQVKGENYLVPIDADISSETEVQLQTVSVNVFLNVMEGSASKVNIVILDACRNNPFAGSSRSLNSGLASVIAPRGTYIAYATAPGEVARDGTGANSPYTQALAEVMTEPGLKLEDTFKRARERVLKVTKDAQVPWESTSITGDFYFAALPVPKTNPLPDPEPQQSETCAGAALVSTGKRDTCLDPGVEFSDCEDCPRMVVAPAGNIRIGSPADEANRRDNEGPQHRITIPKSFAIGKFEVTRGEFQRFVATTGYKIGARCWVLEGTKVTDSVGKSFRDPGFAQDNQHPAVCVSFDDAVAYTNWLTKATGKEYRLLSEAEWEYAARAGATMRYSFGDDEARLCEHGNSGDLAAATDTRLGNYFKKKKRPVSACNDGAVFTQRVGSYSPNGFGLHDLTGNVWEWTADCYSESYDGAPVSGEPRQGKEGCDRVTRGGSWFYPPSYQRSAYRSPNGYESRDVDVGFRVARVVE